MIVENMSNHLTNNRDIQAEILAGLKSIEAEHSVNIIWAIESGSRAWGFPSQNSDYDVRFIYAHKPSHYLSVFEQPDTINLPVDAVLDIAGWDLAKCHRLLHNGNAVLHEWLGSPIVYQQRGSAQSLQQMATQAFRPKKAYFHYYYLARNKLAELADKPTAKVFLYALRPMLCCQWILEHLTAPPMQFSTLYQRYCSAAIQTSLDQFIQQKSKGTEQDQVVLPELLAAYASQTFADLPQEVALPDPKDRQSGLDSLRDRLDENFRAMLKT